jgi:acetyltransferase-like isoleucine patch superfamily enzyme
VEIGDHVWIGAHCSILKGVSLDAHTVVATRSTVTRSFSATNVLVGGSPAKILKERITWSRERFPES